MTISLPRKLLLAVPLGFITSSAAIAVPTAALHAEPLELSTVIRAALERGPKGIQANIRLKLAEARLQQAQGAFDWRATARSGWTRLYFPREQNLLGTNVLTNNLQSSWSVQLNAGMSKTFHDGISIEPGISYFPETRASRAQTLGATRPLPTLNLQVPLLHALDERNSEAAAERAAYNEVTGSQFERAAGRQQAVLDAVQTYWRCVAEQEIVSILQSEKASASSYISSLRALHANGQIDQATVERAAIEDTHREADLSRARENFGRCRSDLLALVGPHGAADLPNMTAAIPQMLALEPAARQLHDDQLGEMALKNRPDVKALEQYVSSANETLESARAGQDPKLTLTANPDGVFLTISKSIQGNLEDGRVAESEAKLAQARQNLVELRQLVDRDVSSSVVALQDSLNLLDTLATSDRSLSQVIEDSRRAVRSGGISPADLRTRERELADLKVELMQTTLDSVLNLASLRLVTGTIETEAPTAADQNATLFQTLHF